MKDINNTEQETVYSWEEYSQPAKKFLVNPCANWYEVFECSCFHRQMRYNPSPNISCMCADSQYVGFENFDFFSNMRHKSLLHESKIL